MRKTSKILNRNKSFKTAFVVTLLYVVQTLYRENYLCFTINFQKKKINENENAFIINAQP